MNSRGSIVLSRIKPAMDASAYKSYSVRYPLSTHWRHASCQEVECEGWLKGWDTYVDLLTELGPKQYDYLIHDRSRTPQITKTSSTTYTFHYAPGFTCFAQSDHRIKIERPPLFMVTGGDWRGNPRQVAPLVHANGSEWADDFANHQDKINTTLRRG